MRLRCMNALEDEGVEGEETCVGSSGAEDFVL